jgi:hypothetical protein
MHTQTSVQYVHLTRLIAREDYIKFGPHVLYKISSKVVQQFRRRKHADGQLLKQTGYEDVILVELA